MRIPRNSRPLNGHERIIARAVFGYSLEPISGIQITDGLGPIPGYDNPFTMQDMFGITVNVGPDMYPDLSINKRDPNFGLYRGTLVHELTHAWQYRNGYSVVIRSTWANTFGKGYSYTIDENSAWDDYNVEQQASIVEDWFVGGMMFEDLRFVFVDKIIRPGDGIGIPGIDYFLSDGDKPIKKLRS